MTEQHSKEKPSKLSKFQGLTEIGSGAFGKVYKAIEKRSQKFVALKKISKLKMQSNQIQILKNLKHPNIIKLYESFDDGQNTYLVMQLAPNGQLCSKIHRQIKLDERTAKKMIKEVLDAVSYLHSRNPPIIHRDIKPQNILLDKNNHVKLADFGLSNVLNKPRKTYCGTFDYLAPEMIEKSGHDEKLDIWCLGVLAYELLTGKTPFVVSGPRNETKKMIEKNILEVKITFPNDFPILAKSFILGMVKRKPEERMALKEIMSHQWLTSPDIYEKPFEPSPIHDNVRREAPLFDAQDSNIIASLNKKITSLQQELSKAKANQKAFAEQSKGIADNPQDLNLMKELRRLKGIEERNLQLKADNQKYWNEMIKKDKEIIQLKGQLKMLEDSQQRINKLKGDKRSLQQKIKKLEKDLENSEIKNAQLETELRGISDSLSGRLGRGENIKLSEAESHQFAELLESLIKTLQDKFEESRTVLLKVLAKQRMTKQKEEELSRLRVQQRSFQQQIRLELKEDYEQQRDKIIQNARAELLQERQKWLKQRAELLRIHGEQSAGSPARSNGYKEDIELQLKIVRELQAYNESTISELKIRIKQLEEELKKKE